MHVSSVSELYATDEVELLLDEIKELEPTSCCPEDIQDFEIAGSVTGGGGRSPVGTEKSWDSHAHYRRPPRARPAPVARLYCRLAALCTVVGLLRSIIVVSSVCACGCVWGLVGLRPWLVPLAGRVRLLTLAALSSALLHGLVAFLEVTRLVVLFPIHWSAPTLGLCCWSAISCVVGGSLVMAGVVGGSQYAYAPSHVADTLLAASGLGLIAGCVSLILGGIALHAFLATRRRGAPTGSNRTQRSSSVSLRAAYRALAPVREPQPSSSRDNQL